jgi:protein CpxP
MRIINTMKVAVTAMMAVVMAVPIAVAQSTDESSGSATEQPKVRSHVGGHHRDFGGMRHALRQLDLTEAQKAQIKQIRESHHKSVEAITQQLRASMQELRQAEENGTFNEALATQKLIEVAPLKARLMGEGFKVRQEMLAVLTPDQKAKLDQMREQFKQKRAQPRDSNL